MAQQPITPVDTVACLDAAGRAGTIRVGIDGNTITLAAPAPAAWLDRDQARSVRAALEAAEALTGDGPR